MNEKLHTVSILFLPAANHGRLALVVLGIIPPKQSVSNPKKSSRHTPCAVTSLPLKLTDARRAKRTSLPYLEPSIASILMEFQLTIIGRLAIIVRINFKGDAFQRFRAPIGRKP